MAKQGYRIAATGDTAGSCRYGVYTWPQARLVQCFATLRAALAFRDSLKRGA